MTKQTLPILEFFDDNNLGLDMFFSNGKKDFHKFDKVKELGIDRCVIFFPRDFQKITKIFKKCKLIYEFKSASSISPIYLYDNKVLIALCPLGGPAAANLMEELIYVGVKYFIGTGSCGVIVGADYDEFFVPQKAIREEGVSYHYLPAKKFVQTSKIINTALIKVLKSHNEKYNTGIVWTTDAMYRETPMRIVARIKDGARAVEMETASLSAVAKAKGVEYGCLLYYSDFNNGNFWQTRIYDKFALREQIILYAVETLQNLDVML